jgi:hypothetical protein
MLLIGLDFELDLHYAGGPDPGFEDAYDIELELHTMPEVRTLVWRMHICMPIFLPYLDIELDLHYAGGPDPGVEDVLRCWNVRVLAQSLHAVQEVPKY